MDNVNLQAYEDNRRSAVVDWLDCLFPKLNLPVDASEEELRESLADGTVLCGIMRRINAPFHENKGDGECDTEQHNENLKKFLFAVNEMGLPGFNLTEMEQGSISAVVECLLCLKDHFHFVAKDNDTSNAKSFVGECLSKRAWEFSDNHKSRDAYISQENHTSDGDNVLLSVEDRKKNFPESGSQNGLQNSVISDLSDASFEHVGEKIHELFQLKRGHYSDLSAAEISEIIKSNSFHNASAKSLLNIVNVILDESIEKKNGEVPHRVACLLKKVVQGIEQQISTQAEQIIHLISLLKSREEKYQLRIRALETLASGTSEESQIVKGQLQQINIEKSTVEERQKNREQDFNRLEKEKEKCELTIANLEKEMEQSIDSNKRECLDLKDKSKKAEAKLEERLREVEFQLVKSRKWTEELEAISESKDQTWKKREGIYQNLIISQSQLLKDLRHVSNSIRKEMVKTQDLWGREFSTLERKLKELTDAAENYHAVLEENRKLYNEVQDLKGNIRVYCRIRPFLHGQNEKATTIDYLGENGELLIRNSSKPGKDGHRMFKFNKVFGPASSQEEVFLDTRPLIRSVLDGYNVCIFAYGQTGSGKTYTMSGPNASRKEEWGVNYRALNDLFNISRTRRNTIIYEVGVQMVEIYNEVVRDLLSNGSSQKRLGIWSTSQPNGLAVPDASMHQVKSTSDVFELMQIGQMNRAVGATALNERSSRSHSVLTVHVRGVDLENGATLRGCLHLVDLAGSERVDRSEVTGDRLKEAQHINKSLSALGDVISALAQKNTHVPYRNSKLTQVLQSSLGGQAKTLMFVQINPDMESSSETISTLKFAERVSGVELGAARSNKEGKDVRELMEQVASLKDALARKSEEVERLQLLKDIKSQSPNMSSKKLPNNSFRHSSSLPGRPSVGGTTLRGRKLLDGRPMGVLADKAASDPEICSEYSDKQSDTGSLQSMDDFKQPKEVFQPTKLDGGGAADVDLLGFGDGDSEERLSDISDSGLSMGTETDGSISSVVEYMLFPEVGKPLEKPQDKTEKIPSQLPRPPPQKSRQAALARLKYKDSPSCSRKSSIGQVATSSRTSKRWQ